jgi:A/G-specific adenine glycosylase
VAAPVAADHGALVAALHAWGEGVRPDLPWRRDRRPWAVLVSEAMLQQTQVARVAPRFAAFVARWPDPAALAADPLADVLEAWAGLGYYRRARDLHAAARVIVERHGGEVPDDLAALRALPGVGPYTARAVLALAFGRDVGVVDTNAARVLSRAFAGAPLRATAMQRLADALVPPGSGRAHTEAVLDLGATVCTARSPRCDVCPLAHGCAWRAGGADAPDPAASTAGTSRPQARFEGSDRQGRGRLLATLRTGTVRRDDLAAAAGWPADPDRALRVADGLVADGLAAWRGGRLVPPT